MAATHRIRRFIVITVALSATLLVDVPARATPVDHEPHHHRRDYFPGPLAAQVAAQREAALRKIRAGSAAPGDDGVVALAPDKFVEATVSGTAQVLTLLVEFGDGARANLGTTPGPSHNEIASPDRTQDNTTIWAPDFDIAHYNDLYFGADNSLAAFYREQSSGNYTVAGRVEPWVRVPNNESFYGDNTVENASQLSAWQFVIDGVRAWYDAQVAAGLTRAQITSALARFDVWDRYDFDRDGDFDEPDGYLDHLQVVHAGVGEEADGGAQGADALWSHFSFLNDHDYGVTGPVVGGTPVRYGGSQIGDTGIWVSEHVVVPENVGVGVLAHEYAHDLGLPDLYNYEGRMNGIGFWSLMSLGSYLSDDADPILGSRAGFMGPWEKLQLGWLDYEVVQPGDAGTFTLSPAARQVSGQEQALVVDVPDQGIPFEHATPTSGTTAWWTGSADETTATLTRAFDLRGVTRPVLTAQAWYDIEAGYDYLYPEYSRDGGTTWVAAGPQIDGSSRSRWKQLRYALPSTSLLFRFRYATDWSVHLAGAFIDDIAISSGRTPSFVDDVESGANGWIAAGFSLSDGTEEAVGDRYYLLEHRAHVGADAALATGPYVFGRLYSQPFLAQHFAYPEGMVVWMVDETYGDNETALHPGRGLALPVDARPALILRPSGAPIANFAQVWDAAFGLRGTPATTFPGERLSGKGANQVIERTDVTVPAAPGIATFDDGVTDRYWSAANPEGSTLVAGHGVRATVLQQTTNATLEVAVTNPAL